MADRLNGKVAILFGAGSVGPGWGNGKATAVLFARNGAHIACVDVNRDAAQETVDIVRGEGGDAAAFACDVTNSEAVKEVVDAVAGEHGRIDVLHNNVGYATMGGPIELDEAAWRRTLDLNDTAGEFTERGWVGRECWHWQHGRAAYRPLAHGSSRL